MMVPPSSLVARKKKEILQTRNFDFIFSLGNDEADRPSSDDVACRKHSSNPDWKLTLVKAEASHRPPFFFSPTTTATTTTTTTMEASSIDASFDDAIDGMDLPDVGDDGSIMSGLSGDDFLLQHRMQQQLQLHSPPHHGHDPNFVTTAAAAGSAAALSTTSPHGLHQSSFSQQVPTGYAIHPPPMPSVAHNNNNNNTTTTTTVNQTHHHQHQQQNNNNNNQQQPQVQFYGPAQRHYLQQQKRKQILLCIIHGLRDHSGNPVPDCDFTKHPYRTYFQVCCSGNLSRHQPTVPQLREEATRRGIAFPKNSRKEDICELLKQRPIENPEDIEYFQQEARHYVAHIRGKLEREEKAEEEPILSPAAAKQQQQQLQLQQQLQQQQQQQGIQSDSTEASIRRVLNLKRMQLSMAESTREHCGVTLDVYSRRLAALTDPQQQQPPQQRNPRAIDEARRAVGSISQAFLEYGKEVDKLNEEVHGLQLRLQLQL